MSNVRVVYERSYTWARARRSGLSLPEVPVNLHIGREVGIFIKAQISLDNAKLDPDFYVWCNPFRAQLWWAGMLQRHADKIIPF